MSQMWKIPRNGVSEVRDQEAISDGHSYDDLLKVSKERMIEYIGSEETFGRAWEITCSKAHTDLHPPVGMIRGRELEDTNVSHEKKNHKK